MIYLILIIQNNTGYLVLNKKKNFLSKIMPINLVKFYVHFLNPFNFCEYLLQKSIDDYEERNKDVKVRGNRVLFKYVVLMTLNEANYHYSKHDLKEKNGNVK